VVVTMHLIGLRR